MTEQADAWVGGYPPAPWHMHGDLWLSLFRVHDAADRPDGIYGAAFVRYDARSPLTYYELLAARLVDDGGTKRVSITDIWVDSPASRDGGRALWAIPKELADFASDRRGAGRMEHARLSASAGGVPIASAAFRDVSRLMPRLPFSGSTWQRRESGEAVVAQLRGSARSSPAIGRWQFAPRGPLGFLHGARRLASFRMHDFEMSFG